MNRFKVTFALAAVALALVCVASVQAASINLDIDYAGSYDALFTPLPGSPPAPLNAENAPHSGLPPAVHVPGAIHQFNIYMTLTGTTGSGTTGEDFQSVIFDMLLGPGVTPYSGGAWAGESPLYDPPPAGTAGGNNVPVYGNNSDAGSDTNDLKGITILANSANNHGGTHHRHPGEAEAAGPANAPLGAATLLGSVFVEWDGTFGAGEKSWIQPIAPANISDPWSTVIGNVGTPQTPATMTFGPREEWVDQQVVDLFAVGDAVADQGGYIPGSTVTGGPLPTNDDDTPDDVLWALLGLTRDDDMGGPNAAVPYVPSGGEGVPTVNAQTGEFSWTTSPLTPRGAYAALIQGTNNEGMTTPSGTDSGMLTWNMVPEPTSITLLGLAMIGAVGFIRRR